MIPCNCKDCQNSREPSFFEYSLLNQYIRQGLTEIDCTLNTIKRVDINSLINDVNTIPKENRRRVRDGRLMDRYGQIIIENKEGEIIVGDKYKTGQAGAVGPKSHAHDMTFSQVWNETYSDKDLDEIASELAKLRSALKEKATDASHDVAIGNLALAETAAAENDGPKMMEYLSKVGSWVFETATDIGVVLVAELIKNSMNL